MRNWGAGQVGRDTEVGGVARTCLRGCVRAVESLRQDSPTSWLGRRVVGLEQERLKRGESDFGAREGRRVPEVGGGVLSGVGELRRL